MMRHNLFIFNSKVKFIIKSILIILIIVCGIKHYGQAVDSKEPYHGRIKQFYELSKEQKFDIMFYGSSHTFCSYNPKVIDKILNINSYNLGNNSQRLTSAKYILEESLRFQKPELVVVDLYEAYLKTPEDEKAIKEQYSNIDYTKFSLKK